MPKSKTPKGRKAYLNDFKRDEAGKFQYEGEMLKFKENGKSRKRFLTELSLMCVILAGAVLINGCIPAPGMQNCAFLLIPYMVQLLAAVSVCYGVYRLAAGGNPIRRYVFEASAGKLPFRTMLTAVTAGVLEITEIIYIVLRGSAGKTGAAVCFLLIEPVAGVSAVIIRKKIHSQSWIV